MKATIYPDGYVPFRCDAAPTPGDPCTQVHPAERRQLARQHRSDSLKQRTESYHKRQQEAQEQQGLTRRASQKLDRISHKVDKMRTSAAQGVCDKVADLREKHTEDILARHFPEFRTERPVYHAYECELMTNAATEDAKPPPKIRGTTVTTDACILFVSSSKPEVKLCLALEQVVGLELAVRLPTDDGPMLPVPVPCSRVTPGGYIVYTRDGNCHCFFDFSNVVSAGTGKATRHSFEVTDWAWRRATKVPAQSYQYSEMDHRAAAAGLILPPGATSAAERERCAAGSRTRAASVDDEDELPHPPAAAAGDIGL
eukprot:TRINITY_DN7788_c0_g1_i1.p1 TRINITY_DN7788_c0_g1~~TRINITY_DN7788_c0_g1_i1.p1  ORF type:complete len:313 (+),score=96.22 TRINITY_DN7788_c0_g1_i1:92-1030(+)